MNTVINRLISFGVVLLAASCSVLPNENISKEAPKLSFTYNDYLIGKSDSLRVDVWRNDDLTRTLTVRPDGYITMPIMGDVLADGRRPEDLAAEIANNLKSIIRSPEVTVTVQSPASIEYLYRVRVMGEVSNPTSIAYVQGITVMDLVLAAGGVTPYGAGQRAVLSRLTVDGYKDFLVDVNAILNNGDVETNFPLQPTDILTIPEKRLWRGEF